MLSSTMSVFSAPLFSGQQAGFCLEKQQQQPTLRVPSRILWAWDHTLDKMLFHCCLPRLPSSSCSSWRRLSSSSRCARAALDFGGLALMDSSGDLGNFSAPSADVAGILSESALENGWATMGCSPKLQRQTPLVRAERNGTAVRLVRRLAEWTRVRRGQKTGRNRRVHHLMSWFELMMSWFELMIMPEPQTARAGRAQSIAHRLKASSTFTASPLHSVMVHPVMATLPLQCTPSWQEEEWSPDSCSSGRRPSRRRPG